MENSESIKEIAVALLKAQSEMGNAKKDSLNPFFKSKYADLNSVREACIPAFNANKISVLQPMVHLEGKNFIKTLLLHESGEFMSGLTEIVYSKQNDAQAQGSGITYARRYGLQSFANIGSEDDDGNKASEKPKEFKAPIPVIQPPVKKDILPEGGVKFTDAVAYLKSEGNMDKIKAKYTVTPEVEKRLLNELTKTI